MAVIKIKQIVLTLSLIDLFFYVFLVSPSCFPIAQRRHIAQINEINWIALIILNRIIGGLPKDNIKRIIVEEASNIDEFLDIFHRRIVAIMINTAVAIPDTTIKAIGATEFPSKSKADDKTDKI